MKSFLKTFAALLALAVILAVNGCDISTEGNSIVQNPLTGTDLVINEVFTISPSKHYAFSWIEIYNPTSREFEWVTLDTLYYDSLGRVIGDSLARFAHDSLLQVTQLQVQGVAHRKIYASPQSDYIVREDTGYVAYPPGTFGLTGDNTIFAGTFHVIISNKDRFEARTFTGPFDPKEHVYERTIIILPTGPGQFEVLPAEWTLLDRGEVQLKRYVAKVRFPLILNQLVSVDSTILDVVRYGNYQPPAPDRYPGNISLGPLPENYSVARYAGYFATGNSIDEFYMAEDPIPGWYSQRKK